MNIINQAHDKLFKETFGTVEISKDFMNGYLPKSVLDIIDMETLQPQKDSFINKELEEVFSDLLFNVSINGKEGHIYFLFEHKSYKDKMVIFQLLRYMIEIWESKIIKESKNELPVIIPLVIAHDKGTWNVNTSLGDMISGYNILSDDIKKYIPNYEYLIYDLRDYNDDDVKLESITRIIVKMFRDVKYGSKDKIIEVLEEGFKLLSEVMEKDSVTHYLEACLKYILSVRNDIDKDEIVEIAENISVEGSELVMTAAQKLVDEGIEIGENKKIIEIVKKGIIKQMKIGDIADLTDLTEKEIEDIRKEMLKSKDY